MALTTTLTTGGDTAEEISYYEIKQGDAGFLPVIIYFNGTPINGDTLLLVDKVEYALGHCVRKVVDAADAWNETLGLFLCPLDQADTLLMRPGIYEFDCRVLFYGGGVLGAKQKRRVKILDANSRRVI